MYDTFSRPCNSLLDDLRGESLVCGNWIGLNSFSASDRAMRGHMAHTVDPLVCYVHGHSFTAQLRSSERPLLSVVREWRILFSIAAEMPGPASRHKIL